MPVLQRARATLINDGDTVHVVRYDGDGHQVEAADLHDGDRLVPRFETRLLGWPIEARTLAIHMGSLGPGHCSMLGHMVKEIGGPLSISPRSGGFHLESGEESIDLQADSDDVIIWRWSDGVRLLIHAGDCARSEASR